MALSDFLQGLNVFDQTVIILAVATHADEGHHFEPERFGIDLNRVGTQDADFFHLPEALGCRGGRKADATAKLSHAQTRISLQLLDELSSTNIKKGSGIHGHR